MPNRPTLSAVLITFNTADSLPLCLESLSFADEILVVDSGSTDGTLAICQQYGARVIHRDWPGFGPQKRFAVEQAANDWVLCVDSDEIVPGELAHAIALALEAGDYTAYQMARSNRFMGRYLRHGEGYPDWSLRLFNRNHAQWSQDTVHEKVITHDRVGRLPRHIGLLHHSAESLTLYLDKQNRYTTLQAQGLFAAGENAGFTRLLLSPALRFIKFYIFRLGCLDGVPGLVHIAIGCFNSFVKYAKLKALQREQS